ncbi:MAG: UV DNA damage repair endonuclease UvsE [Campylobacteraceae bacterium]|nr:UV DNA damage repair endonuclease UvsE [Campylobacteraceae bacterium]
MRFGLFCSTKDNILSTNRSFKLMSLSKERLFQTVRQNLEDLPHILALCEARGITLFRLGNAIVPFASHSAFDMTWWKELEPFFEEARLTCKAYSTRLSIHPGQFIQLGSPNPLVVEASLRELAYCTKVLDMLGAQEGVITLHVGGVHGNKEATMERFYTVFKENPWLKPYLALENDEYNFNALETLHLAKRCGIGMIFDSFHHSINPSAVSWMSIKQSWDGKRPKVHISSQGEGKVGMHAPFISQEDWETLCTFLGDDKHSIDIMVEAKAKEEAIEHSKLTCKIFF